MPGQSSPQVPSIIMYKYPFLFSAVFSFPRYLRTEDLLQTHQRDPTYRTSRKKKHLGLHCDTEGELPVRLLQAILFLFLFFFSFCFLGFFGT